MTFLTTFARVSLYCTSFQSFIYTAMCQTSPCCGETLATSQRYCTNWASVNEWTYVEAPCYTKCPLNIFIGMLCRSLLACSKTKCITYQFTLNEYAWHPPPLNTKSQEPQSKVRGQFSPGPQPVLIALFCSEYCQMWLNAYLCSGLEVQLAACKALRLSHWTFFIFKCWRKNSGQGKKI